MSLLTDFQLCRDYLDWEVGTHGIYIQLPNPLLTLLADNIMSGISSATSSSSSLHISTPTVSTTPSYRSISALPPFHPPRTSNPRGLKAVYTATYLPDVIPEQGWSRIEAVDSAIRKSGFTGKITPEIRASVRVSRYQSRTVEVSYKQWKDWRDAQGRYTVANPS